MDRLDIEISVDLDRIRWIAEEFGLKMVILFGSHVSGQASPKSDVDLAVMPVNKTYDLKWMSDLDRAFGRVFSDQEIDVVMLEEVDPLLHYEIASTGLLLYEKQEDTFLNFQLRATQRNNEAKKFYELDRIYIEMGLERMTYGAEKRDSSEKVIQTE